MKVYNNELTVHRGETFTIDKLLQMPDGSPYILSKRLNNPQFVLTVSSTRYTEGERYVKNWYLDCSKYPKFERTIPVQLKNFKDEPDSYGYKDDFAVFFVEENGKRIYKYYVRDPETKTGKFMPYEFRLVKTFLNSDTKEWVEQSYLYSILLVTDDVSNDNYGLVQTILEPTKLSVLSNIKGALKYGCS